MSYLLKRARWSLGSAHESVKHEFSSKYDTKYDILRGFFEKRGKVLSWFQIGSRPYYFPTNGAIKLSKRYILSHDRIWTIAPIRGSWCKPVLNFIMLIYPRAKFKLK